jgi:hypothetical protein
MKTLFSIFLGAASLLAALPATAHHAFSAEFDINRPLELTGAVTRMEWTNPHAWIYIAAEDEAGNVVNWAIELVGINDLMRLGWGRDKLKVGEVVSIEGFGARNGSNSANAASVTITNTGELLWASVSRQQATR